MGELQSDKLIVKINNVLEKIEKTQNKGSFLVQLGNFKKQISELNEGEKFKNILLQIEHHEKNINQIIDSNRDRNLEIKKALLAEAEIIVKSSNWKKALEEVKDLQLRWKKTGAVSDELKDEIENKFIHYIDSFYNKQKDFFEQNKDEISKYKELIELSKVKIQEPLVKVVKQELKEIQNKWRNLKPIPKTIFIELNNEFKTIHNAFFENLNTTTKRSKSKSGNESENIEKRKFHIQQIFQFLNDLEKDYFEVIKKMRAEWLHLKVNNQAINQQLWDEFNMVVEKLIESQKLHKIEKKLLEKNKNVSSEHILSEKEKYLRKSIRLEKEALDKMNTNIGNFRITSKNNKFEHTLDTKNKIQERKIIVKEELLKNLK